jgi:hypothetical protein
MNFDKNQSVFPSDFHREVWWWAVGMVPLNDSLTDSVTENEKCTPDILEGCRQWHSLFIGLCEDMYANAAEYMPASPRQYRDILENISLNGTLGESSISWDLNEWEAYAGKLSHSKACISSGITLEQCLISLSRTGLKYTHTGSRITFAYDKYPKVFHAMQTMENSPDSRKTPVRHHFAHCEFRQLFKRYDANYDELLRRASDDSLFIAHAVHNLAKSLKIQRYIHFGVIKYKYKGVRVLDMNLYGNEYPTLRINIGPVRINPAKSDLDDVLRLIAERKDLIDKTVE